VTVLAVRGHALSCSRLLGHARFDVMSEAMLQAQPLMSNCTRLTAGIADRLLREATVLAEHLPMQGGALTQSQHTLLFEHASNYTITSSHRSSRCTAVSHREGPKLDLVTC
jgi:hypothetical protein